MPGFDAVWIGEMATYDAFALATAVGLRAPGMTLKIGPLAVGVRSPVTLALGASPRSPHSPAAGSTSRWEPPVRRSCPAGTTASGRTTRRSCAKPSSACGRYSTGARVDYSGRHVRSHGFRLRRPRPETRIALGAFGPAMIRVAAQHADEVVLNLVPPARVAEVRAAIDAEAARGRPRRAAPDGVGAGRTQPG